MKSHKAREKVRLQKISKQTDCAQFSFSLFELIHSINNKSDSK
jgi:hypothetical protein